MEAVQTWGSSERIRHFRSNPEIFHSNKDMFAAGSADEYTPPVTHCQYCGAEIITWAFGWQGVLIWRPEPERCNCVQAREHWQEIDSTHELARQEMLRLAKAQASKAEIDRLMSRSGLLDRYPHYRLDTWSGDTEQRAKANKNARWYVENFADMKAKGTGLYIAGDSERGKTHLAAGIAYELVQNRVPVIMTSMGELLSRLRASYNDGQDSEQRLMMVMRSVDLLIIDDLGKEKPTDWSLEKLFTIVDARANLKLPIIITTNYTDDELFKRLTGDDGYGRSQNDPKTIKAIITRLHRMCISMNVAWQRWDGKAV